MNRHALPLLERLPGVILTVTLGTLAFLLSHLLNAFDALIIGITVGMLARTIIGEKKLLQPGLSWSVSFFIPIGIIFYGVNLRFHELDIVPLAVWLQVVIGIALIFSAALWLGKKLLLSNSLSLLIAVGTAICGASAIALVTPVLKAKAEETSVALLVITIWGLVGLFLYPLIQLILGMSIENYAVLAATTLHQTGLVKTAAAQYGDACLNTAMVIKGARTFLIIPTIYVLTLLQEDNVEAHDRKTCFCLPCFLWIFLFVGIIFSFVEPLKMYANPIKPFSTALWTMAMTGLGLSVDIRTVVRKLASPIWMGLGLWLTVLTNFFIGYFGMGY